MAALIEKLNDLFGSETSEQDQLRYVNDTILGKVAESATLQQRATIKSVLTLGSTSLRPYFGTY